MTSRRRLLYRLSALSGAVGLSGCSSLFAKQAASPTGDLDPNPRADELPIRQHAWNDRLRRDSAGNELPPRHFRLFMLDLDVSPSDSAAETVELAMRTLEDAYAFDSGGLLHMLAWGTSYFDTHGSLDSSPIRTPRVLSRTDDPDLQEQYAAEAHRMRQTHDPGDPPAVIHERVVVGNRGHIHVEREAPVELSEGATWDVVVLQRPRQRDFERRVIMWAAGVRALDLRGPIREPLSRLGSRRGLIHRIVPGPAHGVHDRNRPPLPAGEQARTQKERA
jgi:hypothetical protein